jgi:hypothetical protein
MSSNTRPSARRISAPEQAPAPTPAAGELHYESPVGCLLRCLWMGAGNLVMLLIAVGIASVPNWSFTWRDAAYWATVLGMIGARYLDVSRFGGLTIHTAPATMANVRRHGAGLFAISLSIWILAQSVGS